MIYEKEDLPERRRCNIRSNGIKHGKKHRLSSAQQPRNETEKHHGNRKRIGEFYNKKSPGQRQQRAESRPDHDRPLADAVGQDAQGNATISSALISSVEEIPDKEASRASTGLILQRSSSSCVPRGDQMPS